MSEGAIIIMVIIGFVANFAAMWLDRKRELKRRITKTDKGSAYL